MQATPTLKHYFLQITSDQCVKSVLDHCLLELKAHFLVCIEKHTILHYILRACQTSRQTCIATHFIGSNFQ